MSRPTIVTCFPMTPDERHYLERGLGDKYGLLVSDQQQISTDIFEADIFCGHAKHQQIDWDQVVQQGRLRWIQSSAAGLDHCLHPATIAADEICISGCSALFARQVAEQALTLLLGLIRRQKTFNRAQDGKEFIRRPTDNLFCKTVAILGMGGNGQFLARVLGPLCKRILGTDCFPDSVCPDAAFEVHAPEKMNWVVSQAEVVVAMLPLTDSTLNLVDSDCFASMPQDSYFINVGRGKTVQEFDLIHALQSGHLQAAGLDVVAEEPLATTSPLWDMENVIISPHVGAQSPDRVFNTIDLFCENLKRFAAGERLLNHVDKQLGFPRPEDRLGLDRLSSGELVSR